MLAAFGIFFLLTGWCTEPAPAVAEAGAASARAKLTFTKEFRASRPEYVRVTVDETGEASFEGGEMNVSRETQSFRLSLETTKRLFTLAAELNYFRGTTLESPKSVANLGKKTFSYEKGGALATVTFNWTENPTAAELQKLFERIARGRWLAAQLEFQMQFDRLGIVVTMREFEQEFNAGGLVDAEQFASLLERIAGDRRVARLAQTRAEALLRRVRGAPGRLEIEYGDQNANRYYRLLVEETGAASFESRRFADAPNPQPLTMPPAAINRLLQLVREGNYLRGETGYREESTVLSGYRIVYESGPLHNEVSFVMPPTAIVAEMVYLFKKAVQQQEFRRRLRAGLEQDETSLLVLLQELERAVTEDKLMDPGEFLPTLDAIAGGAGYSATTREQAGRLAARIRAAAPVAAPASESQSPRSRPL